MGTSIEEAEGLLALKERLGKDHPAYRAIRDALLERDNLKSKPGDYISKVQKPDAAVTCTRCDGSGVDPVQDCALTRCCDSCGGVGKVRRATKPIKIYEDDDLPHSHLAMLERGDKD